MHGLINIELTVHDSSAQMMMQQQPMMMQQQPMMMQPGMQPMMQPGMQPGMVSRDCSLGLLSSTCSYVLPAVVSQMVQAPMGMMVPGGFMMAPVNVPAGCPPGLEYLSMLDYLFVKQHGERLSSGSHQEHIS